MQIEESFHDLKSHRWGFAARYARAGSAQRLEVLLLVAALATLVVWLAGLNAQNQGLASRHQANTERRRPVLSAVFIGSQLLASAPESVSLLGLIASIPLIRALILQGSS